MAIRTTEELVTAVNALFPESSDDVLAFLEDLTDSMSARPTEPERDENGVSWKERYEQNDKEWRERYRDRFMTGGEDDGNGTDIRVDVDGSPNNAVEPPQTYDELFTEKVD